MARDKGDALAAVAQALAGTRYAVIGGVALQVHQAEPRTTLDIDLAVASGDGEPRARLEAAGFRLTGQFPHSENWQAPDGTPVQLTSDPAFETAVDRAEVVELGGAELRVITKSDLLRSKLRACADPSRRRSKRLQDLADAQGLLETDPDLAAELSGEERALLERLPE